MAADDDEDSLSSYHMSFPTMPVAAGLQGFGYSYRTDNNNNDQAIGLLDGARSTGQDTSSAVQTGAQDGC